MKLGSPGELAASKSGDEGVKDVAVSGRATPVRATVTCCGAGSEFV
jgi:hypothetical protein